MLAQVVDGNRGAVAQAEALFVKVDQQRLKLLIVELLTRMPTEMQAASAANERGRD